MRLIFKTAIGLTIGLLAISGGVLLFARSGDSDGPATDELVESANARGSTSSWILPPKDAQELVDRAAIVFIGKISGPTVIANEGAYDESGNPVEGNRLPFARYRLEVIEFLAGDTPVTDPPELRLFAHGGVPEIDLSGTYLFALSENPDGSYGTSAGYGMIDISSDTPRNRNGHRADYIDNLSGGSTESFLQAVSAAALNYERIPVSEWSNRGQLEGTE